MAISIEKCFDLAEAARTDNTLLRNHTGSVDRILSARLAENDDLLRTLNGDPSHVDLIEKMSEENVRIRHALTAYQQDDGDTSAADSTEEPQGMSPGQ